MALNTYLRPSSIRRGSVFFPVKCAERGVADCRRRSSIKKKWSEKSKPPPSVIRLENSIVRFSILRPESACEVQLVNQKKNNG